MLLCQGVFTLKGLLFSLSVFMRVVHHASCFHLQSFPDFPLTQLTAAIIWQYLLGLWPSEPLSSPSPSVSHLRSEIRLPSTFLRYNTLFMIFQMLCGQADITRRCLNRSGSHQSRKMNRLPVVPALLEVCVYVCAHTHASPVLQCQLCSCTALAPLTQWQHLALVKDFLQCHSTSDLSSSLPLIIHTCSFKKGVGETIANVSSKGIYFAEMDDVAAKYPLWS